MGRKVVPYEFIETHFNEQSLATWFMGDGSKRDSGYIFCTDSFEHSEVDWLSEFLYKKYKIVSWRLPNQRNHPRLYIPSPSRELFNKLVEPYIVESQQRKLIKTPAVKYVSKKYIERLKYLESLSS